MSNRPNRLDQPSSNSSISTKNSDATERSNKISPDNFTSEFNNFKRNPPFQNPLDERTDFLFKTIDGHSKSERQKIIERMDSYYTLKISQENTFQSKMKKKKLDISNKKEDFSLFADKCFECGINENLVNVYCGHTICKICLSNSFEDYFRNYSPGDSRFKCNICEMPYKGTDLKDHTIPGTFKEYLEIEPNFRKKEGFFDKIRNVSQKICYFCGQEHIKEGNCLETDKIISQKYCSKCESLALAMENCKCIYCQNCIKEHVVSLLKADDEMKYFFCIGNCGQFYSDSFINLVFGNKRNFDEVKQRLINYKKTSIIKCLICYNSYYEPELKALSCGDKFCTNCITEYFKSCLTPASIQDIKKCPLCSKEDEKNNYLIVELLDNKNLELYSLIWIRNNYKLHWCQVCEQESVIEPMNLISSLASKMFFCKVCPYCELGSFRKENIKRNDEKFQLDKEKYCVCPSCGQACEKINGCNFLQCNWPTCKEVYFCALCQKRLNVMSI